MAGNAVLPLVLSLLLPLAFQTMFDSDRWSEIWQTLSRNKLRSALTAFGVGWGIFMLIIMLGAGNGLANGVNGAFNGWASNSCFIWTQVTSIPFEGFPRGRDFSFDNGDIEAIRRNVPGVDALAPRLQLGGWQGSNNVVYKGKTGAFNVNGDVPDIMRIQGTGITAGRFLNEKDLLDSRKICVIGQRVVDVLYAGEEKAALGTFLKINGVYFQVVGTHKTKATAEMDENQDATIYIPFSTFQRAFNAMNEVHWFAITAEKGTKASVLEKNIKKLMAERHRVHPDDELAFGSFNVEEMFDMTNNLFLAITGLGWFVGILTLVAGVVGVSNIMLVIIRERTQEIGIRRSIGATPASITVQILLEALTLTFLAGYIGLVSGVFLLEGIGAMGIESDFFANPEVDITVAIVSLVVLITCGLFAGLVPARRALSIRAVEALRSGT